MCGHRPIDEGTIGRPLCEVRVRQHDEQRRRVGAAVVPAERDLAERRHLASRISCRILPGCASCTSRPSSPAFAEKRQHAARDVGCDPQQLDRRNDAVTAERCAEPRDARVRVGPLRRVGNHHRAGPRTSAAPPIERLVRGDERRSRSLAAQAVRVSANGVVVAGRRGVVAASRSAMADLDLGDCCGSSATRNTHEPSSTRSEPAHRRIRVRRSTRRGPRSGARTPLRRVGRRRAAAARAARPPHLEDIGEVGVEVQGIGMWIGCRRGSRRGCARHSGRSTARASGRREEYRATTTSVVPARRRDSSGRRRRPCCLR